jgi:hypothetical protein
MADAVNHVRSDYKASKHSGKRPLKNIRYFVIHTAEAPSPTLGAESVGRYFASGAARGSTQYGLDINSTQQYLADAYVAWGAPPLNETGLHVECAGMAKYDRKMWLTTYAKMMKRLGWLIASRTRKYDIPFRILDVEELKRLGTKPTKGGIVTHDTVSKAFGQSTHWDPGKDFPLDVVMAWAAKYRQGVIKGMVSRPVLHIYNKGKWVSRLQNDLRAKGYQVKADGVFGKATETAVKDFQKKHGLKSNGVVGMRTWKALDK